MSTFRSNRRDFLKTAGAAAAATTLPYWFSSDSARALAFQAANDRPVVGCIGTGSRWEQIVKGAMQFGDVVAVCDVDEAHSGKARDLVKEEQGKKGRDAAIDVYGDYRKILERKDIDIVTIVTPDHWHSKIAIEAMKAGKDIYCEKPLTLTIDEGKQIIKVLNETKRVFQVGTQQRTEMNQRFLQAIALIQAGRIGKVKKVQCAIGAAPVSGPLKVEAVPAGLNWDMWLGQTPVVDYIPRRCHYEFRWWYEYSGGKMTDWGAHHVDIAQWAIGMQNSGPTSIEGTAKHPVPFEKGYPTAKDEYNAASEFLVTCKFPNDVEMVIRHDTDNGILFEGTEGRFFVNRSKIEGKPIEDLKDKPLPEDAIEKVYGGKKPTTHMENFMQCVVSREQPISDVFTHHRAMTTCHLANIAIRLGRPLKWDPETEQIVGDEEARGFQTREQRKGYEIEA